MLYLFNVFLKNILAGPYRISRSYFNIIITVFNIIF